MAGAIAPAKAPRWHLDRPGAKAPGQRPTRPRRALPARRVGRWPFVVPGPTDLQGTVARGRGNRGSRFLVPPGERNALSPFNWQGPSPLPQRYIGIRTSRGPKPPASAHPAPGQRPARPWRALRPRRAGRWPAFFPDLPVHRAASRAGGGNALRFLFPPVLTKAVSPLRWQGPLPLPQCCAGIRTSRGPKPPASARPGGRFPPAGSGAGLSWCLNLPVYRAPSRAGGETRCVSSSRPEGRSPGCPISLAGAIAPAMSPR